jgi:hypothetical protein
MPVISRLVSICLRVGELAFAAVVAGIIGSYLHGFDATHSWPGARFIYTEVIAAISILLAIIWLLPFAGGFIHWPADLILCAAWFAVFGLLVNFIHGTNCSSSVFDWAGITRGGVCNRWKASEAFSFLSAIFWLASTIVGLWFVHRTERTRTANAGVGHRRWYHRSRI